MRFCCHSTWNSLACSAQIIVPFLGFWLRAVSGSWLPQMALASGAKLLAGLVFLRWSAVTPVRALLEKQDAEKLFTQNKVV
eukprot:SAG22_NODE_1548_length_4150_cov_2.816095_4_plen_81_part_00